MPIGPLWCRLPPRGRTSQAWELPIRLTPRTSTRAASSGPRPAPPLPRRGCAPPRARDGLAVRPCRSAPARPPSVGPPDRGPRVLPAPCSDMLGSFPCPVRPHYSSVCTPVGGPRGEGPRQRLPTLIPSSLLPCDDSDPSAVRSEVKVVLYLRVFSSSMRASDAVRALQAVPGVLHVVRQPTADGTEELITAELPAVTCGPGDRGAPRARFARFVTSASSART